MNLSICNEHWQFFLLDDDRNKADQLSAKIDSLVYHFSNVLSFITRLSTITNAQKHIILVVSVELSRDLPPDIKQKVRGLFLYGPDSNNNLPSFNDVCLNLAGSLVAHGTAQSIQFHHSHQNGTARVCAIQTIALMKNLEQDLQDLCDNIDEDIRLGDEVKDE